MLRVEKARAGLHASCGRYNQSGRFPRSPLYPAWPRNPKNAAGHDDERLDSSTLDGGWRPAESSAIEPIADPPKPYGHRQSFADIAIAVLASLGWWASGATRRQRRSGHECGKRINSLGGPALVIGRLMSFSATHEESLACSILYRLGPLSGAF